MGNVKGLTGNEAAAEAMRQINPDVVAAYPITPQTEAMHKFSEFVADGLVDSELVLVESEHSAMSATVGASAAGSRAMTATSSQGLALMHEILYIAASTRLPIVMPMVNRALSGPINIHNDHSDSMGSRDAGWIQLFAENSQEVYDNVLMGIRIAEHKDVLTPVMVCYDGFIISHTMERVEILDDEAAKKFVGTYDPVIKLLDHDNPITIGPLDLQDYYFEHRRAQYEGMKNAPRVIKEVSEEFGKLSGRNYDFIEVTNPDADIFFVVMGSAAGTLKHVIFENNISNVGVLKIRSYRPFPRKEIADALNNAKAVAVLDKSLSFGLPGGPLYNDVEAALYHHGVQTPMVDYIVGLGGRDLSPDQVEKMFEEMESVKSAGKADQEVRWVGLREKGKEKELIV
ncbi:MAG: 2-ketoisovalerate ferredoxin oxidoreductase subunit alpha [Calditrichia bacterium]